MIETPLMDVRAFYTQYITLAGRPSRAWRTDELEYHGNCPWCGGRDRFAFWSSGRYSCSIRASGCGRYGRDVIDFLREYAGLSFGEACDELGLDPGQPARPPTSHQIAAEGPPPRQWQERAAAVIQQAQRLLWSPRGKATLDYVRQRGFTDETIRTAALGYIPLTRDGCWYRDAPERWGLTQEDDVQEGVWLPEGILIPWSADGQLWKLQIRRLGGLTDGGARYVQVKGSREGLYNVDMIRVDAPLVLCESECDALAGQQVCGDLAVFVATGAVSRARRDRWLARMGIASCVLVAYDDDAADRHGRRAGDAGAAYWVQTLPHALRWLPWAHDVNEMLTQHQDLHAWVTLGIAAATTALAPVAVSGSSVRQLPASTAPPAGNASQEDRRTMYARLLGATRVSTLLGAGVIYPHTPLATQIQRGRIGVLLERPVHASGRRLEYFFPQEVQRAEVSQLPLVRGEVVMR